LGIFFIGVIPEVQNEGELSVRRGRHPVLLLRGVQPVENAIELTKDASALVISGPNAGGKVY
jgi:DNA mismatch repair protein MutS2